MTSLPRRLFVVAAHPDDDTIGCGGTIALVAAAGGSVRVAYLSDGSRSHPGSRLFSPARIAALRAAEARAALAMLGVRDEPQFFDLQDGTLSSLTASERSGAVTRLARAIDAFRPDLLLAPWIRDPHPDHVACAAIARDAVASLPEAPGLAWYEVWLPVRGTGADRPAPGETNIDERELDTATRALKRRAILAHRTQTSDLIDDDPNGFRIDDALLDRWTGPIERIHFRAAAFDGDCRASESRSPL